MHNNFAALIVNLNHCVLHTRHVKQAISLFLCGTLEMTFVAQLKCALSSMLT